MQLRLTMTAKKQHFGVLCRTTFARCPLRPTLLYHHLLKLLGETRQDFMPITGDEYVVFNANPAPTGNIHPRFDGNYHPRLEHDAVLLDIRGDS